MTMAERSAADVRYGRLILGGVAAGAVVFGVGSRVAMRVVGIMASPQHVGEPTAFGTIGRVTVAGVVGLVIFGSIAGFFSGAVYLALRPWLPGTWPVRGLVLGLLILSPVGIAIVTSSRADFDLASVTLIFALFGGMILLEGLATAWLIERLGRETLPPPQPRPLGYIVLGAIALLGFVALTPAVSAVS